MGWSVTVANEFRRAFNESLQATRYVQPCE